MRVIRDNLWLCVDCTLAAVNDDFTGLDYHYGERANERMDLIVRGLESLGPHLVPDFDSESGEGILDFGRPARGCDCCGSGLAGGFHRFAVLGEDPGPVPAG